MPHAQLVPRIGIVDRQIRHHEIRDQQLLEHIDTDVAAALLLVGPEGLQARVYERRFDEVGIYPVEIDGIPVWAGLGAEGHYYESMGKACHGGLSLLVGAGEKYATGINVAGNWPKVLGGSIGNSNGLFHRPRALTPLPGPHAPAYYHTSPGTGACQSTASKGRTRAM